MTYVSNHEPMSSCVKQEITKTCLIPPLKTLVIMERILFWILGNWVFHKFEMPTQSRCPLNSTAMQDKMWQSKRCWILSLFTYYWKGHTNENPAPYPPTHPLKIHQVRRGSLHQLKRLHMEIHRKDRFQYIIFEKWYSQRFAPLLFYKIFDLLLICIFTLSNATRFQDISHF